jgi:hypothetical protein
VRLWDDVMKKTYVKPELSKRGLLAPITAAGTVVSYVS